MSSSAKVSDVHWSFQLQLFREVWVIHTGRFNFSTDPSTNLPLTQIYKISMLLWSSVITYMPDCPLGPQKQDGVPFLNTIFLVQMIHAN